VKRKRRIVFRMRWMKHGCWALRGSDRTLTYLSHLKAVSEKGAREICRAIWEETAQPCQLLIHRKDGAIARGGRSEASYGCNSRARG
jgi:hypothetical protein